MKVKKVKKVKQINLNLDAMLVKVTEHPSTYIEVPDGLSKSQINKRVSKFKKEIERKKNIKFLMPTRGEGGKDYIEKEVNVNESLRNFGYRLRI